MLDALVNYAGTRGLSLITDANRKSSWRIMLVIEAPWISIYDNLWQGTRELARHLSFSLNQPGLAIQIDLPIEWKFWAFDSGNATAQFEWHIPLLDEKQQEEIVRNIEVEKALNLGLRPALDSDEILQKLSRIRKKRISASDPKLEVSYRKKLSDGLVPPPPDVPEDLPKNLARIFEPSAAIFRKILSVPLLSIQNMAAEFSYHMRLPDIFRSLEFLVDASQKSEFQPLSAHYYQFG